MDTIVAIATSLASSAGVNIIRVSGNDALRIAKEIFESKKVVDGAMVPNFMYLGRINGKNFTEKAFCVYYKSPFSYTGEDVIEVHCHGGINVTRSIVSLIREKGARPAEAGEFTRRAFLNNKLTLAEAEGVIDMINATSESQMLNAYRLMDGYLTKGIVESERLLIETSALLEAKLDYPEELEEETRPVAYENLKFALNEIEKLLKNTSNVKTVTGGVDVAIVGVPNAGKSSLLNAILQTDRAIVSDIAGTTRDVLKESVEIDGIKLNFLDTAGIREGGDKIENMGIERSKNAIKGADVVLFVKDTTVATNEQEKAISELLDGKKVIEVDNKCDVGTVDKGGIKVCAKLGTGVENVIAKIMKLVNREAIYSEGVITNERHIFALNACREHLVNAIANYDFSPSECTLMDIRSALDCLGKITGNNASEDVIDEVFSRFCVGK